MKFYKINGFDDFLHSSNLTEKGKMFAIYVKGKVRYLKWVGVMNGKLLMFGRSATCNKTVRFVDKFVRKKV